MWVSLSKSAQFIDVFQLAITMIYIQARTDLMFDSLHAGLPDIYIYILYI